MESQKNLSHNWMLKVQSMWMTKFKAVVTEQLHKLVYPENRQLPWPGEFNKLLIKIVSYPTNLFMSSCCHLEMKKKKKKTSIEKYKVKP